MKVFSTASIVGQAFRNATRVREIIRVLAVHGFADLLHRMGLRRFLPSKFSADERYSHLPIAERLRLSFEQLGPTFVKLGQLLASRPDVFPVEFIQSFEKLQDRVATIDASEIKRQIEHQLKKNPNEIFETFDDTPLAAASISQVHAATLKTGEKVAIKVQRPGIQQIVTTDVSILKGLAILLEKYLPETRIFNPTGIVDEFFRTISYELDFRIEANNIRRIRNNLADFSKVAIPRVYGAFSTGRVLVLERFEGIRVSDAEGILEHNIDVSEIVDTGCEVFFHMVMIDGCFHGDFHAGNLFIMPDGRLALIDFGIVGRLSRRSRESVTTMFVALMDEDYEALAAEYGHLSQTEGNADLGALQKDLMDLISPYIGMSLGEVDIGTVLLKSTAVAAKHKLRVPKELMLLFKAIGMLESLGNQLDPHFDLLTTGTRLARQSIAARYSKERVLKDMVVVGRDLQYLAETTPRLIKRYLRKWSQQGFAFETTSKDVQRLSQSISHWNRTALQATLGIVLTAIGLTFVIMEKEPILWGTSITGLVFISLALGSLVIALWQKREKI